MAIAVRSAQWRLLFNINVSNELFCDQLLIFNKIDKKNGKASRKTKINRNQKLRIFDFLETVRFYLKLWRPFLTENSKSKQNVSSFFWLNPLVLEISRIFKHSMIKKLITLCMNKFQCHNCNLGALKYRKKYYSSISNSRFTFR